MENLKNIVNVLKLVFGEDTKNHIACELTLVNNVKCLKIYSFNNEVEQWQEIKKLYFTKNTENLIPNYEKQMIKKQIKKLQKELENL